MNNDTQEKLQALFIVYTKKLPNKIYKLQIQWQTLCEKNDFHLLNDFHRDIHSLCGSASTYGYTALSKIARDIDAYVRTLLDGKTISIEQKMGVTHLMKQLQTTALSSDFNNKNKFLALNKCVYLLDSDLYFVTDLFDDLQYMGYELKQAHNMAELLQMIQEAPPIALVVDTEFLGIEEIQSLIALQNQHDIAVPLFCTAASGQLSTRLQAVRAGSQAFLLKPVDTRYLAKIIDQFCGETAGEPYRILILDDSASLAEFYALILQDVGMTTHIICDPLQIIDAITVFQPDLLLLDIYMPECSGIELAAVLRQEPKYTHLPIIFLSAEDDKFKQLAALGLGGDDFLMKPVLPQHLVAAVKARAKRAGVLSSYIARDSLTGLLNHSNILHQLDVELVRAERYYLPLCFVMLDVDYFKLVNDQFGHLVGDHVLKKISDLFTKRLRRTDYVGRYGGEEFAIVLPNTELKEAKNILEELRQKLENMRFVAEGQEFTVTFSAGIANFPYFKKGPQLIEAADKALYQAKHRGRNQVVIYEETFSK